MAEMSIQSSDFLNDRARKSQFDLCLSIPQSVEGIIKAADKNYRIYFILKKQEQRLLNRSHNGLVTIHGNPLVVVFVRKTFADEY